MTHSKDSLSQLENHNKHREDIDYLLDEKDSLENYSENFAPVEDIVQLINVSSGTYEENLRNFYAKYNSSKKDLKDNFDFLESIRKSQIAEKGHKDKQKKHLIEFVVSLSEEKTKEYLKNGVDIKSGFQQYVKDLKKMGIHFLELDIHNDEGFYEDNQVHHNFHAHIIAYNYNFKTNKAIASNFRKRDYRKLQTLAQDSFRSVGLDYKRGKTKILTNKSHLRRQDYILQQQIKEKKLDLVNLGSKIKSEKIVVEELKDWHKDMKEGVVDFLKLHLVKKDKNYFIKSVKVFKEELIDLLEYVSNFDLKLEELNKYKSDNKILLKKIDSLLLERKQFLEALDKLKIHQKRIKSLIDKNENLIEENYQLMQFIKNRDLEDDYLSFISNNKKENEIEYMGR